MTYHQKNLEHSLLFPATNVTEDGKLIFPPYRIFCLPPTSLLFGLIGQKKGLKYFVEEGYLCRYKAKKFIKKHEKHNLWNNLGIICSLDQKCYYKDGRAMIYVKSRSGHDTQTYHITYDKLPRVKDKPQDIIKSLTTQSIVHQCEEINIANTCTVQSELVKKWLKGLKIKDLKIIYLCPHIMHGWLYLANEPLLDYGVDYHDIFKEEKLVKEIGPQLRWINKGILRFRDLNKEMYPEIFDDTKLNDLINKELFNIWAEETQN